MRVTSTRGSGPVLRSLSPSPGIHNTCHAPPSSTSTSSTFFLKRSVSPARVTVTSSSVSTVKFSLDRPNSPRTGQFLRKQSPQPPKRTCMCSPTNHPGSFRCSLHKGIDTNGARAEYNRLQARRSAMTNSLVRICGVEGDLMKRSLAALIRPSSHSQRRSINFQKQPSRFFLMSKTHS